MERKQRSSAGLLKNLWPIIKNVSPQGLSKAVNTHPSGQTCKYFMLKVFPTVNTWMGWYSMAATPRVCMYSVMICMDPCRTHSLDF